MGQGSSWRRFQGWPHLQNWWEGTTEPSQQFQKISTPLAWPSLRPVAVDGSQLTTLIDLWLRHRLEMTPNTNKTHLHHGSIHQQPKCWNTWICLSTFPRKFHRNLNPPSHPQWQMNFEMAWEMSKILNWILNKWSTWQKQDMYLDSSNSGLSPMSSWIYICIHISYIYLSLEMQLCSWFF